MCSVYKRGRVDARRLHQEVEFVPEVRGDGVIPTHDVHLGAHGSTQAVVILVHAGHGQHGMVVVCVQYLPRRCNGKSGS